MTDPREEKLPKWAKDILRAERRRAIEAEEKLAEHLTTVQQSRIWFGGYDNPIYVPEPHGYQTVHFNPLGDDQLHHTIQVRINGEGVEINGGSSLNISPMASNLLYVRTC